MLPRGIILHRGRAMANESIEELRSVEEHVEKMIGYFRSLPDRGSV